MNALNIIQKKWVLISAVVVVLCVLITGYQNRVLNQLENNIDKLNDTIYTQNEALENLAEKVKRLSQDANTGNTVSETGEIPWFWTIYEYPSTPQSLLNTLSEQGSLIPFKGVLGGTPYFVIEEGRVLDSQYVYLPIEDGHVMGGMILKYEFLGEQEVMWTVIDGWWPADEIESGSE